MSQRPEVTPQQAAASPGVRRQLETDDAASPQQPCINLFIFISLHAHLSMSQAATAVMHKVSIRNNVMPVLICTQCEDSAAYMAVYIEKWIHDNFRMESLNDEPMIADSDKML